MPAEPLRLDLSKIAPEAYRHFLQLEGIVGQHVDRRLLHLLKLRVADQRLRLLHRDAHGRGAARRRAD